MIGNPNLLHRSPYMLQVLVFVFSLDSLVSYLSSVTFVSVDSRMSFDLLRGTG
jgi:hypothetical protein